MKYVIKGIDLFVRYLKDIDVIIYDDGCTYYGNPYEIWVSSDRCKWKPIDKFKLQFEVSNFNYSTWWKTGIIKGNFVDGVFVENAFEYISEWDKQNIHRLLKEESIINVCTNFQAILLICCATYIVYSIIF